MEYVDVTPSPWFEEFVFFMDIEVTSSWQGNVMKLRFISIITKGSFCVNNGLVLSVCFDLSKVLSYTLQHEVSSDSSIVVVKQFNKLHIAKALSQ